eukprot:6381369-Prymnesium_polylepis.1
MAGLASCVCASVSVAAPRLGLGLLSVWDRGGLRCDGGHTAPHPRPPAAAPPPRRPPAARAVRPTAVSYGSQHLLQRTPPMRAASVAPRQCWPGGGTPTTGRSRARASRP